MGDPTPTAILDIHKVSAALAVCSPAGTLQVANDAGARLLARAGFPVGRLPMPLPEELFRLLAASQPAEAVDWWPESAEPAVCIGCTRHDVGSEQWLLFMREVTDKHARMLARLHKNRLESTGQLVASVAHDLRASIASIVYNADVLLEQRELPRDVVDDSLSAIREAALRLRTTVDGLLDFARLGPNVAPAVEVRRILARLTTLLRPMVRDARHKIEWEVADNDATVRGNPIVIEQILVNLALNAFEASPSGARVRMHARRDPSHQSVQLTVEDDGPGIPASLRDSIFLPFFTTKSAGTGLGLPSARDAARQLGGDLRLLHGASGGARFCLTIPAGELGDAKVNG